MENTQIILYHTELSTQTLGPGKRFALWVQGCNFKCEGCLVPDSWEIEKGVGFSVEEIAKKIVSSEEIEGVTISGGEPFLQDEALLKLLYCIKADKPSLSIMIFTGYTLQQLKSKKCKNIDDIISLSDILIDGKYDLTLKCNDPWRGSSNQTIHFLTNRYTIEDYKKAYMRGIEYIVHQNGTVFECGVP